MTSWWRSWHGAPTDAKWLLIASKAKVAPGVVSAVFWALCDYASQQEDRGSVSGFDRETYAAFSGFDLAQIDSVIDALNQKQLIANGKLTAWEKRQPKREDDSSDRVTAHRERKRQQGNEASRDVTQCNAPERTEQIEQKERERARAVSLCREIARVYDSAGYLPPDTGRAYSWLAQGYDPALIVAKLSEKIAKGKPSKPLAYFDPILADAHAVKSAPKKTDTTPVSRETQERAWDRMLTEERKNGAWSSRYPKSEIPPEYIARWESQQEGASA